VNNNEQASSFYRFSILFSRLWSAQIYSIFISIFYPMEFNFILLVRCHPLKLLIFSLENFKILFIEFFLFFILKNFHFCRGL
jgi:hypothetical protein